MTTGWNEEDWSVVKQRWEAWWECEWIERPLVCVTAPRDGVGPRENLDVDPETQWVIADYIVRRTRETIRTTYYGGEAIPWFWNPISAGHALYFGCKPHFRHDTMWVDPAPAGEDGFPVLEGWRESPWWRWARESIEVFARASDGRFFVLPFMGNHAGDTLAVVRGVEPFFMDFALNPRWVKSAVKEMSDILIEVHEALWQRAHPENRRIEGSLNYVGCWSPARTLAFDCDISCNVSPTAFRELLLPPLVESMQFYDHRIYHLDGAVALHHLDTLLDLPEIHAIQWVPGTGHEEITQWIPLIQRIQSGGKGIVVYCEPEEVIPLLKQVRPEGLCISTRCETEGKARALLALAARFYR